MHLLVIVLMALEAGAAGAARPAACVKAAVPRELLASAQTQALDDPAFAIGDLELDVRDLAAASAPEASGAMPLPRAGTPIGAVLRLAHAYALGRVADYGALMTSDFRYEFADPELQARFPGGFAREDEMASLEHLVHGFTDREGIARPRARSMSLRFDRFESVEDPDHAHDPVAHALVRVRARLRITLATGEELGAFEGIQEFHVVRGDHAVIEGPGKRDAGEWFVRRWVERAIEDAPEPERAAPVVQDARRPPAAGGAGHAARDESARAPAAPRFALDIAPSGRAGALLARVSLPEPGEAKLDLFDVAGRRMASRSLESRGAGVFEVRVVRAGEVASGVYWLQLRQSGRTAVRRVHLLR